MVNLMALALSAGMFVFSTWIYSQTGDWVALLFMLLSAGYGTLFTGDRLDRLLNRDESEH